MTPTATLMHSRTLEPAVETLIRQALEEDLGHGDMTTDLLPELFRPGTGWIVSRQSGIVSGLEIAETVFRLVDPRLEITFSANNGERMGIDKKLIKIAGPVSSMLKAERVALNFLQHLSGIATETRKFVDAIADSKSLITDTRKTTPGLRLLEKRAVVHGGGRPHRFNLSSAVMLKDNHIEAVGSITHAVNLLRQQISHTAKIEVEADTLAQAKEALDAGADIILLDNMTLEQLKEAVILIDSKAITEASGGVTLETVAAIAKTGVDYISTSRITLGAPPIDIALDLAFSQYF